MAETKKIEQCRFGFVNFFLVSAKDKVSNHEKLVFRSGVRFLFLFVLMDAILLKLDLQKRTNDLDNPPNQKLFV